MKLSIINSTTKEFRNNVNTLRGKISDFALEAVDGWASAYEAGDDYSLFEARCFGDKCETLNEIIDEEVTGSPRVYRMMVRRALKMRCLHGDKAKALTTLDKHWQSEYGKPKATKSKAAKAKAAKAAKAAKPTVDVDKLMALVIKHGLSKAAAKKLCTESFAADLLKLVA